jgi:hypothetical protein
MRHTADPASGIPGAEAKNGQFLNDVAACVLPNLIPRAELETKE